MSKSNKRLKITRRASATCITAMIDTVTQAGALITTVSAFAEGGDDERAFDAVLDIDSLLHEATHLLQTASILRRAGRP